MAAEQGGRVVTFYSYKGGTGRSMALANVAWILASNGRRVLCIDWDLEAPGLHRYFAPFLIDPELFSSDGVVDFVWGVAQAAMTPAEGHSPELEEDVAEFADLDDLTDPGEYIIRLDWEFPDGGVLDLIPAGRQGPTYAERVNAFDWDNFYERLGGGPVLNALVDRLRADYDIILIDSRTGVSDTSGICTVQLPDSLVVLFTLNNQSMRGAEAVAGSVRAQRDDLPIFPVPTRVDPFEKFKLNASLRKAKSLFAPFVEELAVSGHVAPRRHNEYWGDMEFPYDPYYAYEEVLASFADERGRNNTLLAAATRLARHIAPGEIREPSPIPDEIRDRYLAAYAHDSGFPPDGDPAPSDPSTAAEELLEALRRSRALARALAGLVAVVLILGAIAFLRRGAGIGSGREAQIEALNAPTTDPGKKRALVLALKDDSTALQGANLAGVDLSQMELGGIDLRSANLRGANLKNTVLDSANLAGADLSGADMTNAKLRRANLTGATLIKARMDAANLLRARVENGSLETAITSPLTVLSDSTPGPYRADEDIQTLTSAPPASHHREGYIWIGNYDRRQSRWEKVRVADSTGQAVTADPSLLEPGTRFRLLGDLTLRAALPKDDLSYYSSVVSLGWIPRGSIVTLVEPARAYQRPSRVQYWSRVRVDTLMR